MNTTSLLTAFVPLLLATAAAAQVQIPINPRATFLRTNNDTGAVPAPGIPLSAIGGVPGQWLSITTTGSFSDSGGSDTIESLICVFSSNPTLLPSAPGVVQRVSGAITAGAYAVSPNTSSGNLTTDINEDFVITRNGWTNGAIVKVPVGASYLFYAVSDNFYGSNNDPNSDYFAVFAPVSPATLQGTAEHVSLRTGVNGTPTATPDLKQANAFATVSAEIPQVWGYSNGDLYILAANLYATAGQAPVGPLPDTFMGTNYVLVQYGIVTASPGLWSVFIPPGVSGQTLILQSYFLNSNARNGLLFSSDAHRIQLL